jgi:hypothetical protein
MVRRIRIQMLVVDTLAAREGSLVTRVGCGDGDDDAFLNVQRYAVHHSML